jgi:methylase of polypeptide subunit release factors
MCQQSLINYLDSELNKGTSSYEKIGDFQLAMFDNKGKKDQLDLIIEHKSSIKIKKEDIETLIHMGEHVSENEETALVKEQSIKEGKQKTSDYKLRLPESIRKNAELIDEKLSDITVCDPAVGSGAFPVGMMGEIVRARNVLSTFIKEDSRSSYEFKRRCIEHSLYGVDIDPGAVEIAKLRLWLSLVVDEEDIKKIKPLPNLDYKIVCGNSLLGVEKNLFNKQLFKELEELKPLYFNETNPSKKQEYKKYIDKLINEITNGHTEFDFEVYFSEVFHDKGGFDVVIGNPPYVQLQKDGGKLANLYKSCGYQSFKRTGDIYTLFYEKGVSSLKKSGHLIFITSNKWMRASYGKELRSYFTRNNPIVLIDLGPGVFESATVDTNILILQKSENKNALHAVKFNNKSDGSEVNLEKCLAEKGVTLRNLTQNAWFIGSDEEQKLKKKLSNLENH